MKTILVHHRFSVVDLNDRFGLARDGLVEFVAYTIQEVEARAVALGLFNDYPRRAIQDQWLRYAVTRLIVDELKPL